MFIIQMPLSHNVQGRHPSTYRQLIKPSFFVDVSHYSVRITLHVYTWATTLPSYSHSTGRLKAMACFWPLERHRGFCPDADPQRGPPCRDGVSLPEYKILDGGEPQPKHKQESKLSLDLTAAGEQGFVSQNFLQFITSGGNVMGHILRS